MTNTYVTQAGSEVWLSSNNDVRSTLIASEVWYDTSLALVSTQSGADVWGYSDNTALDVHVAGADVWGYSDNTSLEVDAIASEIWYDTSLSLVVTTTGAEVWFINYETPPTPPITIRNRPRIINFGI